MSTDAAIRERTAEALEKWSSEIKPNVDKTVKYIIDASNYKKASNRKSEN
jgi:hypothetical protein